MKEYCWQIQMKALYHYLRSFTNAKANSHARRKLYWILGNYFRLSFTHLNTKLEYNWLLFFSTSQGGTEWKPWYCNRLWISLIFDFCSEKIILHLQLCAPIIWQLLRVSIYTYYVIDCKVFLMPLALIKIS